MTLRNDIQLKMHTCQQFLVTCLDVMWGNLAQRNVLWIFTRRLMRGLLINGIYFNKLMRVYNVSLLLLSVHLERHFATQKQISSETLMKKIWLNLFLNARDKSAVEFKVVVDDENQRQNYDENSSRRDFAFQLWKVFEFLLHFLVHQIHVACKKP